MSKKRVKYSVHPVIQKRMDFYNDLFSWIVSNHATMSVFDDFDCEDYGGMPKRFRKGISDEQWDNIRAHWDSVKRARSFKFLCKVFGLSSW
jgi:predicted enzyme related to lactoylglutathione lyase